MEVCSPEVALGHDTPEGMSWCNRVPKAARVVVMPEMGWPVMQLGSSSEAHRPGRAPGCRRFRAGGSLVGMSRSCLELVGACGSHGWA